MATAGMPAIITGPTIMEGFGVRTSISSIIIITMVGIMRRVAAVFTVAGPRMDFMAGDFTAVVFMEEEDSTEAVAAGEAATADYSPEDVA